MWINKPTVRLKSVGSTPVLVLCFILGAILGFLPIPSAAAAPAESSEGLRFLGAASCGSSGCHGGGGQRQNQSLIWSLKDFHSHRPVATLSTARSKQIAEALGVKEPATEKRCTGCHAPLRAVPPGRQGEAFAASEGVSCESCHGPAERWLRSHTRPDWTHPDRVQAGMRDLQSLYVRANTCVACHQSVETALLKAGHPELIFELDGQCVSEPRHWREKTNWSGAQAWFVGQAVALREISWQLSRETGPSEELKGRWNALLWLLQKLDGLDKEFPALSGISLQSSEQTSLATLKACDELAKHAAATPWTEEMSRKALKALAFTSSDFQKPVAPSQTQARRAERLVLALDRLLISRKGSQTTNLANKELNRLFELAQSIPDFAPSEFAAALNQFSRDLVD